MIGHAHETVSQAVLLGQAGSWVEFKANGGILLLTPAGPTQPHSTSCTLLTLYCGLIKPFQCLLVSCGLLSATWLRHNTLSLVMKPSRGSQLNTMLFLTFRLCPAGLLPSIHLSATLLQSATLLPALLLKLLPLPTCLRRLHRLLGATRPPTAPIRMKRLQASHQWL
jgi:hypothetical protein